MEKLVTLAIPLNKHTLEPYQMHNLHGLIMWLEGYRRGSTGGEIPGYFELVMLYRTLAEYQGQKPIK